MHGGVEAFIDIQALTNTRGASRPLVTDVMDAVTVKPFLIKFLADICNTNLGGNVDLRFVLTIFQIEILTEYGRGQGVLNIRVALDSNQFVIDNIRAIIHILGNLIVSPAVFDIQRLTDAIVCLDCVMGSYVDNTVGVFLAPQFKREILASVYPLVYVSQLQQIERIVQRISKSFQIKSAVSRSNVISDLSRSVVMVREINILAINARDVNSIRQLAHSFILRREGGRASKDVLPGR